MLQVWGWAVLLEDKIVLNALENQDMRVKDFIHMALAYKCAPKYMYAKYGPFHYHIIRAFF